MPPAVVKRHRAGGSGECSLLPIPRSSMLVLILLLGVSVVLPTPVTATNDTSPHELVGDGASNSSTSNTTLGTEATPEQQPNNNTGAEPSATGTGNQSSALPLPGSPLVFTSVGRTPPPATGHVCLMNSFLSVSLAQRFQFFETARALTGTNWSLAILPSFMSARMSVQSLVLHDRHCDVLLGCLASTPTIAISPLVNPSTTAWVDGAATSKELTGIVAHPAFSRTIPTDEVGGAATANLAYFLGWRVVSVLCENGAYGRSVAEAFSAAFTRLGGEIDISRCFETYASQEEFDSTVESIVKGRRSRIMFVAGRLSLFQDNLRVADDVDGWRDNTVLLMPDNCIPEITVDFPGTLCATYKPLNDPLTTWRQRFDARNVTDDAVAFNISLEETTRESASTLVFKYTGADAMDHAMRAYYTYHTANKTEYPTIATWVRGLVTDGLTGRIELDENGDRASASMVMLNTQRSPVTGRLAVVEVGSLDVSNVSLGSFAPTADRPARFFWPEVGFSNEAVKDLLVEPQQEDSPSWIIPGVAALCAAALLAIASVFLLRALRYDALSNAPLDDSRPFAVLFVGLSNEAALNDACTPESIELAIRRMAKLVRQSLKESRCYEAQRVNHGTFMIVAKTAAAALDCAASVAAEVNVNTDWSQLLVPSRDGQPRFWGGQAEGRGGGGGGGLKDELASSMSSDLASHESSSSRRASGTPTTGRSRQTVSFTDSGERSSEEDQAVRKLRGGSPSTSSLAKGQSQSGAPVRSALKNGRSARMDGDNDHDLITLRVNIGVAHGFSPIDYDKEHQVVSYLGPLASTAAAAADSAVPGQIVATEAAVDAAVAEGVVSSGTFDLYKASVESNRLSTGGSVDKSTTVSSSTVERTQGPTLYTYMPRNYGIAGEVTAAIEDRRTARRGQTVPDGDEMNEAGEEGSGAIASALTRAQTGVAQRRCAVVALQVPSLLLQGHVKGTKQARRITADLHAVAATARSHKCHVHDVVGPTVIITVNAVGPVVSSPALRAAIFARCIVEILTSASSSRRKGSSSSSRAAAASKPHAGVAAGPAVIGSIGDVSVALGTLRVQATAALAAACDLTMPLIAVANSATIEPPLTNRFPVTTVDALALSLSSSTASSTANESDVPPPLAAAVRLVAIGSEADQNADWLHVSINTTDASLTSMPERSPIASLDTQWTEFLYSTSNPATTASPLELSGSGLLLQQRGTSPSAGAMCTTPSTVAGGGTPPTAGAGAVGGTPPPLPPMPRGIPQPMLKHRHKMKSRGSAVSHAAASTTSSAASAPPAGGGGDSPIVGMSSRKIATPPSVGCPAAGEATPEVFPTGPPPPASATLSWAPIVDLSSGGPRGPPSSSGHHRESEPESALRIGHERLAAARRVGRTSYPVARLDELLGVRGRHLLNMPLLGAPSSTPVAAGAAIVPPDPLLPSVPGAATSSVGSASVGDPAEDRLAGCPAPDESESPSAAFKVPDDV